MTITKVEAWSFDGKTYPTEAHAVHAAVVKVVTNEAVAKTVIDQAHALLPLLQRVVEIKNEDEAPRKFDGAAGGDELDAEGHRSFCRARATGQREHCNCEPIETADTRRRAVEDGMVPMR